MVNLEKQMLNGTAKKRDVRLTQKQYDQFKKEFTMIGLHGEDYANAFCRHFKIVDYMLSSCARDIDRAEDYIIKNYVNSTSRNVIEYYD